MKNFRLIPTIKELFLKTLGTCFVCVLFFSTPSHAQFLNKDAVWTWGFQCPSSDPPEKWNLMDSKISKDTLIDGKNFSVFVAYQGTYALRESDNIVYYRTLDSSLDEWDTTERVLYNFNLSMNDTFSLHYRYKDTINWVVYNVDSILVQGQYKKRLLLKEPDTNTYRETFWIEDIGSSFGPFWFIALSNETCLTELNCYSINDQEIYGKCTPLGINEQSKKINKPTVFYDSRQNLIHVNTYSNSEKLLLNIYTLSGIKIFEKRISGNANIVTEKLVPGLYIIEFRTDSYRVCEKIIIK